MLKFEKIAKIGDIIRAYDFKPMFGREDCYVEGTVKRLDSTYYMGYVIDVLTDSWSDADDKGRVGQEVLVPMQAGFSDFDARIINLSRSKDYV